MEPITAITIQHIDFDCHRLAEITVQTDNKRAQYTLPPVNCFDGYLGHFYSFISPIPSCVEEAERSGWTVKLLSFDGEFQLIPPADTSLIDPFERLYNWAKANVQHYDDISMWIERHHAIDFWDDEEALSIEFDYDPHSQIYRCILDHTTFYGAQGDDIDLTHLFYVLDTVGHYARQGLYPYCPPFDGPIWNQGY